MAAPAQVQALLDMLVSTGLVICRAKNLPRSNRKRVDQCLRRLVKILRWAVEVVAKETTGLDSEWRCTLLQSTCIGLYVRAMCAPADLTELEAISVLWMDAHPITSTA